MQKGGRLSGESVEHQCDEYRWDENRMKKWVYSKEGLDTRKGNRPFRTGANGN
jgi:hypothetical protein